MRETQIKIAGRYLRMHIQCKKRRSCFYFNIFRENACIFFEVFQKIDTIVTKSKSNVCGVKNYVLSCSFLYWVGEMPKWYLKDLLKEYTEA